ncbi:guanitoxin biosynthesis MATE family efflux transporter GntT [Stenomitos frigidus]|uniref:guanitoxin biosynthesis MATE family efflux transporter GntT n=1 Tax=Stenomitos frigidus TaxID=1886765 RepID=UPI001FEA2DBA|nr:guanitoxin biosynthesis MATE family efflux transporter GntT [Stenomitos frigidus]
MFNLQPPTFLRQFLKLTAINILSNVMVPIAGLLDVAFLGHLADIRHLAGVSLATVVFNYLYWTFGFLRMSTTGLTAQAIGRGEEEEALLIGLRHGLLALLLGVAIVILQVPLRQIGFAMLSATPEVSAAGQTFYNALIWGAPATLVNFVIIGWLLGRSQSDRVLILTAVNSGANVALDYWLIVHLDWASAGAGIATAASQYLMLVVGLGLLYRDGNGKQRRINVRKLWDASALTVVLVLNRDILIRTFALISTFAVFTNLSSAFGTVPLTANAILMQVVTLAAYFIDGIAFATESLAGLFRGQGRLSQLQQLVLVAGGLSLLVGVLFAIAFISYPDPLFGRLTDHASVLLYLKQYVLWLLPVLGFGSIAYMLDGYFLGLTEGWILRQSMLQAVLLGFVPIALIAWYQHNNHWLWLSLSLFMAMRALSLSWQWFNGWRRTEVS